MINNNIEIKNHNSSIDKDPQLNNSLKYNENGISDLLSHDYSNIKPRKSLKKVEKMISLITEY